MSINVKNRVIEPGNAELLEDAWALKERIRREANVLKQRKGFFSRAYNRSTVYCVVLPEHKELIGFAATRQDGYIMFLAVSPDYQGDGFGEQLVARVADNHRQVSCHARVTNEQALGFYENLNFSIVRRINNYYEDNGDAYYLRLGDESNLTDRLSAIFNR